MSGSAPRADLREVVEAAPYTAKGERQEGTLSAPVVRTGEGSFMRRMLRVGAVAIAAAAIIGRKRRPRPRESSPYPGRRGTPAVTEQVPVPGEPNAETPAPAELSPVPAEPSPVPAEPKSEHPAEPTPEAPAPALPGEPAAETLESTAPAEPPVDRFESGATASPFAAALAEITPFAPGVHRLAGADRFETAVAISQRFVSPVPVLYVATGADFPERHRLQRPRRRTRADHCS